MIKCYEVACSKVTSNCTLTYFLFHTLQSFYELLQCLYHLLTVRVSLRTLYNLDAISLKTNLCGLFKNLFTIYFSDLFAMSVRSPLVTFFLRFFKTSSLLSHYYLFPIHLRFLYDIIIIIIIIIIITTYIALIQFCSKRFTK